MKNPLRKRYKRELKKDWLKNLSLFLILALVIGFVSAMFVGNESMMKALNGSYEKYNTEDGRFQFESELSSDLKENLEKHDITLYEEFYKDCSQDNSNDGEKDATVRVFKNRLNVDKACLMEGKLPSTNSEIAIDRMHADNNDLKIGDTIYVDGSAFTITGFISLPDYVCLYENNSDFMFDALSFNVAVVTDEAYENIDDNEKYSYAYKYDERPANDTEAKEKAEDLLENVIEEIKTSYFDTTIANENKIVDFVPAYLNNGINFAPDDLEGDLSMSYILLVVFVIVIAFIFAVSARNTIHKEATTIGTLRASGFTRGEILRHYLFIPSWVTLFAAIFGNILGYTYLKNVAVSLYYNSYSLPTYKTVWSVDAFIYTTLIPVVIMLLVNFLVIVSKIRMDILNFLRGNLSKSKRSKAVRLPRWKFMKRFRLRIILQNIGGYLILAIGLFFVVFLLTFATAMPETINKYQKTSVEEMFANYQYVLKTTIDENGNEIKTDNENADKYSYTSLETVDGVRVSEPIGVYGVNKNNDYIDLAKDLSNNEVYVSSCYADKFGLKAGDSICLKEKYGDKTYEFEIVGIYDYQGALCIFMDNDAYNETFDLEEGSFTGYLSDEEITDIEDKYIVSVIDKEDITKVSRQLKHSMGGMMDFFRVALVIVSALLVIVLTKIITERNALSISMVKVLGFKNSEIASLYIMATGIVAFVSIVISVFLSNILMAQVWRWYLKTLDGWLAYYLSYFSMFKIGLLAFVGFIVAALVCYKLIKKIPMTDAIKNVE
ncbi:ABC transporter permease [Lachnospira multipara]|uniref:ABC transporter permease n=1 Tax=Lachnospira multipara TaxID=28051 RepID=UPI000486D614|nr:FtsX-like permease family protein [Lachnospira multipara]